ncbi:MAG: swr complex subunit [Sclerophora amabilis]|nr:MAG: swr complex subunit [Sclerophora amabilis]
MPPPPAPGGKKPQAADKVRSQQQQQQQQQQEGEEGEEDYNSSSDSDFDPDHLVERGAGGAEGVVSRKNKRRHGDSGGDAVGNGDVEVGEDDEEGEDEDEDGDGDEGLEGAELDSGDETTIRKGRRKKRRRKGVEGEAEGADDDDDDEVGGEGGLIKTRAQRAKEQRERKPLASATNATVDVDALWASMVNGGSSAVGATSSTDLPETEETTSVRQGRPEDTSIHRNNGAEEGPGRSNGVIAVLPADAPPGSESAPHDEETITIKRTYDFAGETITEEKRVLKSSAEAKLYLQSQSRQEQSPLPSTTKPSLRRPKKRTSMFEPNPSGAVKGLPSSSTQPSENAKKGPKLNTIEKSKMDWAGFVDKEGIAGELDEHSRAKEGYLGRMDFLGRVEANKDEEWKKARK